MNRVAITRKYVTLPLGFVFIALPWAMLSAAADFMERRFDNFAARADRKLGAELNRLNAQIDALSSDERFKEIEEQVREYRDALLAKDTSAVVALGNQLEELKGL